MTFSFASDDSRSLTVGLQSITASNTLQGVATPLTSGVLALIDSTVPHIWLPRNACDTFAEAFGLQYDAQTELYLVHDINHTKLQRLNPTVSFKIGNTIDGGDFVNIELPYLAFVLQASSPFYPTAKNYFPLRRANNDSQYTLGRTFLQEAYIIVDYERSNFSVGQALFKDPNPQQIVTIKSAYSNVNSTSTSSHSSSHSSSHISRPGVIAGIALGVGAALLGIFLIVMFLCRKRSSKRSTGRLKDLIVPKPDTTEHRKPELAAGMGSAKFELATDVGNGTTELDSQAVSIQEIYTSTPFTRSREIGLQVAGFGDEQHFPHELSNGNLRYVLPEARGGH